MDSYTKLKLGVGLVLLISVAIIAFAFRPSFLQNENRGVLDSAKLVDANDTDYIDALRSNKSSYVIKLEQEGKGFLKLFLFKGTLIDGKASYMEVKLSLSKKQFYKITEGNEYWFDIQFYGRYPEWTGGTVKKVYTYNPAS